MLHGIVSMIGGGNMFIDVCTWERDYTEARLDTTGGGIVVFFPSGTGEQEKQEIVERVKRDWSAIYGKTRQAEGIADTDG